MIEDSLSMINTKMSKPEYGVMKYKLKEARLLIVASMRY